VVDRAVFINYRGEDSHSYGALLYQGLTGRFGNDLVFLDAESIAAGADFVEELLNHVRSARVAAGRDRTALADSHGPRHRSSPD
jgi:hypothetical protein